MKFNLRNFFAFGFLASLAFLILFILINSFVLSSEIASTNNWTLFGITKDALQIQMFATLGLVLLFGIIFLVKANFKFISGIKQIKLQDNSKELWTAVVLVFLIVSVSSIDFNFYNNESIDFSESSDEQSDYVPDEEIVAKYIDIDESLNKKTLLEVSSDIGITIDEAYAYFKKNKIIHSGNDNQSMLDIADVNELTSSEIYDVLNGELRVMPKSEVNTNVSEEKVSKFAEVAKDMNLETLAKVIVRQQPKAKITKESISQRLRDNDIIIDNNFSTIGEISTQNKVSIDDILQIISSGKRERKSGMGKLDGPPDFIKNKKNKKKAKKLPQMSLSEIAIKYKFKVADMTNILEQNGIDAEPNQSVVEISKNNNKKPADILKLLKSVKNK